MKNKATTTTRRLSRYLYVLFTLISLIFVLRKDFRSAVMYAGLSLAFDPFDPSVAFGQRPLWQKAWLIVHVLALLAVLTLSLRN